MGKTVTIKFNKIKYPGADFGFPFDVNRGYEVDKQGGTARTNPDQNGITAEVYYARGGRIMYRLSKFEGQVISDVFLAFNPPYENLIIQNGPQYGGTATIS